MPIIRDPENLEFLKLHSLIDFTDRVVLEIGCGNGRLTDLYQDMTEYVVGIDLNFDSLQIAYDDAPDHADFMLANSFYLPFRKNSFDIALFSWSL